MKKNVSEIQSVASVINIGDLIKEARKRAKLTQDELADKIGTNRTTISRIERDASSIKLSSLVNLVEQGLGGKLQINIII